MVKAIFFDLDGTLTQVKSPWQRIHEKLGMWEPEGVKHLNDWLAGRIDYDTFFFRDVAMWMGRERQVLEGALAGIPFWPQTAPLLAELKKLGLPAIIISSGFRYLADKLARECGFAFKEIHANDFRWDPGGAMRGIRMGVSGATEGKLSKGAILRDACYRLDIEPAETLAVGDSTSDLPMFEAAGTSILLNDKPVCAATAVLPPGELAALTRYL